MKVDFGRPILNRKREQMRTEDGPMTLGFIAIMALDSGAVPGESLSVGEKKRYDRLASKIYDATEGADDEDGGKAEVEITDSDYALIRQRIGKTIAAPRIVTHAIDLLEADKANIEDADVAESIATEDA